MIPSSSEPGTAANTLDKQRRRGRAVWFTGPERVEVLEEEVPPPGPNEVQVEALMSLISPGTETLYYRGMVPGGLDVGLPTATVGSTRFPVKFGYATVGKVCRAGVGVEELLGKTVFARHPHQDVFTLAVEHRGRRLVRELPPHINPEVAAFLNLVEVAHNALLDVPVMIGDVAVVFGCGIVGLCIAQLARRTARSVIAVDPVSSRRERAAAVGLETVVTPEDVADVVARETGGRLADVVFEASGSPAALQQALSVTSVQGTIAVVSFYGDSPVTLDLGSAFHTRALRIVGTMVGWLNPALGRRWDMRRRGAYAIELLARLSLAPLVTHRMPLDEAAQAYAIASDPSRGGLGIVLRYGPPFQNRR